MLSTKRKLQLLAGFATLLSLALAVGCQGFFKDPVLTSIAVNPPTPNVTQADSQQMSAFGTFDDGSREALTKDVSWSALPTNIATISNSGLLRGVSPGSVTITASSQGISGSTTATVSLGNVTALTIDPTTATITKNATQIFNALATIQGQTDKVDVSSSAQWSVNPTGTVSFQNVSNGEQVTPDPSITPPITVTITATYTSNGTTFTASVPLIINP